MSAEPVRAYLGIGEVLAALQAEFPDISVSKIRYLEAEGLIQPARSPSGYRKFLPSDVERLRYILTAQRDEYLPLRVIKDKLEAGEASSPADDAQHRAGRLGRFPAAADHDVTPLTRRELLEATGISEQQLAELEEFGLVRRTGRHYGPEALDVVRMVATLDNYGVQARHLRVVKASVEREISLIEQVVAPVLRQRQPGARQRAARTAREVATLALGLHAAVLEAALAEAGFGD